MPDLLTITNQFVNGTPADADEVNENFTDVKDYVDARLGNATSGQILVANASGVITNRTMSGDATISNTGVITLTNDSVNAAKIAAGAVGTSEVADGAVTNAKLTLSSTTVTQTTAEIGLLDGSFTTCVTMTPGAGTYLVFGTLIACSDLDVNGGVRARFLVAGVSSGVRGAAYVQGSPSQRQASVFCAGIFTVGAGEVIALQGIMQTSGTDIFSVGTANANATDWGVSRLERMKIAA